MYQKLFSFIFFKEMYKIQLKPLNVIILGKRKSENYPNDNINQKFSLSEPF